MRILYLSPEHISGTLTILKKYHQLLGDECRFLTMFHNLFGFEDDLCLNLPCSPARGWFAALKEFRRRLLKYPLDPERPTPPGYPPEWRPDDKLAAIVFQLRELLWTPLIRRYEQKYRLLDYDVYQFDMGLEFYRDGRWIKKLKNLGKHLIAFYHGTDIRNRGVIKKVDETCDLHLTSELDLLTLHPKLRYLFLPFDFSSITPTEFEENPKVFRIGHIARNRKLKGTEIILQTIGQLQKKGLSIELVLIENTPHDQVIFLQRMCHLAIDQLTDLGGWGYGMSSLEFLSLGIPVITKMRKEYLEFLPDHPFLNSEEESLERIIEQMIFNPTLRLQKRNEGLAFVQRYHSPFVVMRQLYDYYAELGWISNVPKLLETVTPPKMRLGWLN